MQPVATSAATTLAERQISRRLAGDLSGGDPAGHEPILSPGDACVVEMIDGDAALRVRKAPERPGKAVSEWVFVDEVLMPDHRARRPNPHPDPRAVLRMMARKDTKAFADLRDRAACMYVTGAHPTHMRPFLTGALNVLSETAACLKTLKGLTPYEFICKSWTKEPERFRINPIRQTPGPNT